MGLLDFKMPDMDSPQGQGLLAAAFSLMGAKGNSMSEAVGDAGMKYMGVYQNARSLADQKAMRDLQMKQVQMQMEDAKRKQEAEARQRQWSEQLPGVMGQKVYGASDVGPTMEPDVNALNQHLMSPDSPFRDKLIESRLFPKDPTFHTVGSSLVQTGKGGVQEVFRAPEKPKELDPNKPFMVIDGKVVPNKDFQNYELKKAATGAPKPVIDLRDPTAVAKFGLSFTNDYNTAFKGSWARSQAYAAMLEAAQNPSPKGDLTMVYSLVKAYDPESVVREGEISLLEQNRSIPDKIKGYAQRLEKGESLLPHERADMLNQARTLSMTDYKRTRSSLKSFRQIAEAGGLNPDQYAVDPYDGIDFSPRDFGGAKNTKGSTAVPKRPPMLGQVVDGYKFKGGNPSDPANWEKQ